MVAETIVRLEPLDGAHEGALVTARPDATGSFVSAEYVPGRYRVIFSRVDQNWRVSRILWNGDDLVDGLIELSNDDVSGLVVTLTDKDAVLTGTVTDDARAVQPRIVVFPADLERWIARGMHPGSTSNRVRANEAGDFRVTTLLPGRYFVAAISPASRVELQNPEWVRRVATVAARVEISADKSSPVTLTLVPPGVWNR